jgi:Uri superfamily endonuclease
LRGVYTLIICSTEPCKVLAGRRHSVALERGLYLYTGSALGRGSTSLEGRIGRHLSREKRDFWHIDRILSSESVHVISVILAKTTTRSECKVNTELLKDSGISVLVRGIGASDCRCKSHFLAAKDRPDALKRKIKSSYARLGLRPYELRDRRIRRL